MRPGAFIFAIVPTGATGCAIGPGASGNGGEQPSFRTLKDAMT